MAAEHYKADAHQDLVDHMLAVARVSEALAANLGADTQAQAAAYCAGLLHDIGKAAVGVQAAIATCQATTAEESEQEASAGPHHNEISYAALVSDGGRELLSMLIPGSRYLTRHLHDSVTTAILWHHACRADDQHIEINQTDSEHMCAVTSAALRRTARPGVTLNFTHDIQFDAATNFRGLPGKSGAVEKIVRACLVAADHAVTCLSSAACAAVARGEPLRSFEDLSVLLDSTRPALSVYDMPRCLTERDRDQMTCVVDDGILTQVNAPSGFGKTRVGVLRTARRNRKTLWVCPRNALAEAVYANVCCEVSELGLDASVELYLANSRRASTTTASATPFTADIVVTNIDMLLKPQTDYTLQERMYSALSYDIVFDEFHEFAARNSPLFAAFLDLINARIRCKDVRTLCLSATPMHILETTFDTSTITYLPARGRHFQAVHTKPYSFELRTTGNTMELPRAESGSDVDRTLVMFNSIRNAQRHTGKSNQRILVHSRYTAADRKMQADRLLASFGRFGSSNGDHVVTTPILQTALNISFLAAHVSSGGAEADVQAACVNRFGEAESGTLTIYDMRSNLGERAAVAVRWDSYLRCMWVDHLMAEFGSTATITHDDLYRAYNSFYTKHGDTVLRLLRSWQTEGLQRMRDLAPRRPVVLASKPTKSKSAKSHAATLRKPDGDYAYIVRSADGRWLPADDAFSCSKLEIERLAAREPWITDTRKLEKLVRTLGRAYRGLERSVRLGRHIDMARNSATPLPVTTLRYNSDDGVVYPEDFDFAVW